MCEAQCFALMGLLFKVMYLFIPFLLYNLLFTLKEGSFEAIFFAVEATLSHFHMPEKSEFSIII